ARVDAGDVAVEVDEDVDEGVGGVPRADDPNLQAPDVVRLEVELHHAAAGHADVFLEVPLREVGVALDLAAQHALGLGDGLGLDAAAGESGGDQSVARQDGLGAGTFWYP